MSLYRLYKIGSKEKDDMSYDEFKEIQKEWKAYYGSRKKTEGWKREYALPEPKKSLPYGSAKMSHRPAHVHVPSDKAMFMLEKIKMGEELTAEEKNGAFDDYWQRQVKLAPTIGYRLYFNSISMDAGWFSTSLIEKYETKENGDVLLTTANSIYVAELAQDEEGHWKELDEKTEKELADGN